MRLNSPGDHLTRLSLRQDTAQHKPAVLRQHSAIIEFQLCIVATDADHTFRRVCGHDDCVTCLQRQGIDETVCTTIIVGLETLELTGLLCIWTSNGLTGGITWETVQPTIHREGLEPIARRQKLEVEASLTSQFLWYRLIEPDGYLYGLSFSGHHDPTVEIIVIVTQRHLDGTFLLVHLPVGHLRHKIPLLRGVVQTDSTSLDGTHAMLDDLDARILLVVESTIETVAKDQYINALSLEIA